MHILSHNLDQLQMLTEVISQLLDQRHSMLTVTHNGSTNLIITFDLV
jgi:Fe-S cluster assembly ATPase SufC